MIKITINIYVYVIECPYTQLFTWKKYLHHSHKTKLNLINVQMQPKRDTIFILPWYVEVQW